MKIDKCFIVSLPERLVDRLIPMIDEVKKVGLDYTVFNATKNTNGALGLVQTMQKLFTECIEKEYEIVLVLEDDAVFIKYNNVKWNIEKCLLQLPVNFDCLFLGCNLWQERIFKYSENLLQLYDAYGTHSVIYSKQGMIKILDAIDNIEVETVIPLDILIKEKVMTDKKTFCSFPNLTSQRDGFSNIQNKNVFYKKFLEERFSERTKHL